MNSCVNASITPRAAAKLLISGEMDLTASWPDKTVENVLEKLLQLPVDELLWIVDGNPYGAVADVRDIPQFAKMEMVERVPAYFKQSGQTSVDYAQLGFYLRQDISASLNAKTKFGENYGKGASLLGLAACVNARIRPSVLSGVFASLPPEQQRELSRRLLFRIPPIQTILRDAGRAAINGYAPMVQLSWKTMDRRRQSIKAILRELESFQHPDLTARIKRIYWDKSEVTEDA